MQINNLTVIDQSIPVAFSKEHVCMLITKQQSTNAKCFKMKAIILLKITDLRVLHLISSLKISNLSMNKYFYFFFCCTQPPWPHRVLPCGNQIFPWSAFTLNTVSHSDTWDTTEMMTYDFHREASHLLVTGEASCTLLNTFM